MDQQTAINMGLDLVARSKIALLGLNGPDGFPIIKAMLNMEHEGLQRLWFTTNTSSKKLSLIQEDPKVGVYFVDQDRFMGLLLVGMIKILTDQASKERLWRPGFEIYYSQGVDDPDYTVLEFIAQRGNFYHGLSNADFEL